MKTKQQNNNDHIHAGKSNEERLKRVIHATPSYNNTFEPTVEQVETFCQVSKPHVESFSYFLQYGLSQGIKDIEPIEMDLVNPEILRQQSQQSPDVAATFIDYSNVTTIKMWIENVKIGKPIRKHTRTISNKDHKVKLNNKDIVRILPRECRERKLMYSGPIQGTFCYSIIKRRNGVEINSKTIRTLKQFGDMPIMVRSSGCHLETMSPKELAYNREEQIELGGYFIVNGIERVIRFLQIPRRNYATAIQRGAFRNRGSIYTDLGVSMRSVRHNGDETSITNTVHYLTTGGANIRFVARKQEFLIPVILLLRILSGPENSKSIVTSNLTVGPDAAAGMGPGLMMGVTDEELYNRIVQGNTSNTFLVARAGLLLQDARARFPYLNTPIECLEYIGSRFRRIIQKSETTSDAEIGHTMIRKYILIHLAKYRDKLECMIFMLRKLYAFAGGECGPDNPDSLQNHELMLPGHFMCSFVKEKFVEVLELLRDNLRIQLRRNYTSTLVKLDDPKFWSTQFDRSSNKSTGGIGKKVSYFLATGNVVSTTGLDLMQTSGFTIVAERINFYRYFTHFQSVHRGAFFMEMKTTAVRKLLPDGWGFLCPVHTPDGGPCGLLNHLAITCKILSFPDKLSSTTGQSLDSLLLSIGVTPNGAGGYDGDGRTSSTYHHVPVSIDGRIIGSASPQMCKIIVAQLRQYKVQPQLNDSERKVPETMELAYIPPGSPGAPYSGLYIFTGGARMVRPVLHRASGAVEYIGPLEQGFMDIACLESDIREGVTTHQELDPTNMLNQLANMTPFSDQNQSPRNMYQCQMAKQTMGTPCHGFHYRSDNKLYRLTTPQAPICQTGVHGRYKVDEFPNGTNAVVAVLSYTGFDMEDAMILNKSSFERGMKHGMMYKQITLDLQEEAKMTGIRTTLEEKRIVFANKMSNGTPVHKTLDDDGLPSVGQRVFYQDVISCTLDTQQNTDRTNKHKDREIAYVENVKLVAGDHDNALDPKAIITLRYPRNPVIGDKFASRHGQKGVLSILWPQEDMPFTESGMSPDIMINPHAFPSRMTIGMLVESMAGKSGALHGHFQDATPFSFHESGDKVALDYFGEELQAAGYNYYGSEALYSGTSGCVLKADMYIGLVYYQRLRHMVSDKYQVRATGTVNPLTRQPIKGRKKGGGIRLGEMERDSLLSHGAAFLLQDRLLNCSDKHIAYVCSRCGDMLMPTTQRSIVQTTGQSPADAANRPKLRLYCRSPGCLAASHDSDGNDEAVEPITLPYVYRYLINELAGMNIKMTMQIQ